MNGKKKKLRVLHFASFAGNIGDLANHAGARRMLNENLGFTLEFTDLEIREFYWSQRSFDDAFVAYANSFDNFEGLQLFFIQIALRLYLKMERMIISKL